MEPRTHKRRNPQNGLCVSALHDRAYDHGLMTVLPDDFTIRVSPALRPHADDHFMADALPRYDGAPVTRPERFRPAPEFLRRRAVRFGFMGGAVEIHSKLWPIDAGGSSFFKIVAKLLSGCR